MIKKTLLLVAFLLPISALAENWSLPKDPKEIGVEMTVVSVLITSKLTGTLTGQRCKECELIQLRITPETKYFSSRNQPADLLEARSLTGRFAVVGYEVATKEVVAISRIY